MTLKEKIENFLTNDPSEDQGEEFYLSEVLPYDKRSIAEILSEEHSKNSRFDAFPRLIIHFDNSIIEQEEIRNAIKYDLFDYFADPEDGCIYAPTIRRNLAIQDQLYKMGYDGIYGNHWSNIEFMILQS